MTIPNNDKYFQEVLYRIDNWISEGFGWVIGSVDGELLLVGGRGLYLVPFVLFVFFSFFLFFYFSFLGGKVIFNSLAGRVRDSSSAGQSKTHVSILKAYNSFVGGWEDFGCK